VFFATDVPVIALHCSSGELKIHMNIFLGG